MSIKHFNVTGMNCAACSARVEKSVASVPGVQSCTVSLLTHSMGVEGNASDEEIVSAVIRAGYGATVKEAAVSVNSAKDRDAAALEIHSLKIRLISSIGFLTILLYLSMGHMMLDWPVPEFLHQSPVMMGLAQLFLTTIILLINHKFFVSGMRGAVHMAPNMDTLVALGAGAAFVYSSWSLCRMIDVPLGFDGKSTNPWMEELYFESAAMIVTLITVGKLLEALSKGKTTNALKDLIKLRPEVATRLVGNEERTVPVSDLKVGEVVIVRPGETIPVDGIVIKGESAVNEATLTGESVPTDKSVGNHVSAATINQTGMLHVEVTRLGENTALSQIIRIMSDAAATKAPIARIADKVSGVFVPTVMVIALITLIVWVAVGQTFGFALARAISVLVISCPCALGLATPVAIVVGSGLGAKHGILFRNAAALETVGKIQTMALDKTGTVTTGNPEVVGVYPSDGHSEEELLGLACALEHGSNHPLAHAIMNRCKKEHIEPFEVTAFKNLPGNGVQANDNDQILHGGNKDLVGKSVSLSKQVQELMDDLALDGKTPLLFARGDDCYGVIAVADTIRKGGADAVDQMKELGIDVVMVTGDHEKTAKAIGKLAHIENVVAGMMPDEKAQAIKDLKRKGLVGMVGDGINDAPSLVVADVGMAVASGTDIAVESAEIVLMKNNLADVPAAIRLGRATLRNIHQNLFWAFFYNIIGIPLAAGVFIPMTGWMLTPAFGAAAMSLSSFCVVSNALRLNFFDIYRRDGSSENTNPEGTRTIKIEGMHCEHCEATVGIHRWRDCHFH